MLLIQHGFLCPSLCRDLIAGFQQISKTYEKADDYVRRYEHRTSICGLAIKRAAIEAVSEQICEIRQRAADAVGQFYDFSVPIHIDFTLATEIPLGDCAP